MSKRDPSVTLRQILEHARRVQELSATTLPEILNDWKLAAAFEREMEILGEAVKRLPADMTAKYPSIPWKQIAGTRDRISHGAGASPRIHFAQAYSCVPFRRTEPVSVRVQRWLGAPCGKLWLLSSGAPNQLTRRVR
jgi:uncharacterized protein with HEPN domain